MGREYAEYFQAKDRKIIYNKIITQMFPNIFKEIQETFRKPNRKKNPNRTSECHIIVEH